MSKPLVIVGNGQMAEVYWSLFAHWTDYDVAGFAVDRSLIKSPRLLDLPLVPLEEIEQRYPPGEFHAFVAIGPVRNNTVRAERFLALRGKGYRFASFISPHAVVSPDARLGEHVTVGHFSVVSPWVRIGDNVVIGSASCISHHCQVGDHAFLPLNVIMAGSVVIGERAFVGTGATIRDNVTIGEGSVVGAGSAVLGDVEAGSVYASPPAKPLPMRAEQARL